MGGLGDPPITTLSPSIKALSTITIPKNNRENNRLLFLNNNLLLKIPATNQPPRENLGTHMLIVIFLLLITHKDINCLEEYVRLPT